MFGNREIKKAMSDFAKQIKEQKLGKAKQYKEGRKHIQEQVEQFKEKGNSNMSWGK